CAADHCRHRHGSWRVVSGCSRKEPKAPDCCSQACCYQGCPRIATGFILSGPWPPLRRARPQERPIRAWHAEGGSVMEYFPEHMALACRGGYRAAFRLFSASPVRYVSKDGLPLVFATEAEAKAAARECLSRVLNPPIRAEKIEDQNNPLEEEFQDFI